MRACGRDASIRLSIQGYQWTEKRCIKKTIFKNPLSLVQVRSLFCIVISVLECSVNMYWLALELITDIIRADKKCKEMKESTAHRIQRTYVACNISEVAVAASHAAVSGSIPGRVSIFNKNISPWCRSNGGTESQSLDSNSSFGWER